MLIALLPLLLSPLVRAAPPLSNQIQRPFIPSAPPATAPLLAASFKTFAQDLLEEWHVPGLAVGVFKLAREGEHGWATEGARIEFVSVGTMGGGKPVDEDTLFGIASNSKAFTAAAVGVLADRGVLNWTSKVPDLIPEFQLPEEIEGVPSVIDILSHRTGLPRHDHSYSPGMKFEDFVNAIGSLRPSAELRETWQYNNQMFMSAAFLVQQLSKTPFTTFVTSSIFDALNMTSTTFDPIDSRHLSDSFMSLENGTVVEIPYGFQQTFENLQVNAGAGGVVTSAKDAVKWVEFLVRARNEAIYPNSSKGLNVSGYPVSPASILEMSTAHMSQNARGPYLDVSVTNYGLGLELLHYQGHEIIMHGGSIPGFGTQVLWSSEHGVGVVAFCNTADTGNAVSDIASYRAVDELLGLEKVDWNTRYKEKRGLSLAAKNASRTALLSPLSTTISPPCLPIQKHTGLYHDAAYGNVTVCLPSPPTSRAQPVACTALHARLASALSISSAPANTTLLISRPGFFSQSHLALSHRDGDVYAASWGYVFGSTKEREERMVGYEEVGDVEVRFVVEEEEVVGMEWKGVWGPGAAVVEREKKEGRKVEVAFDKVGGGRWGME